MGDLISRNKLKEMIQESKEHASGSIAIALDFLIRFVDLVPTVEAEPVVHGEWIPVKHDRGGHECSVCHEYAPSFQSGSENLSKRCPECGAKMGGGEKK